MKVTINIYGKTSAYYDDYIDDDVINNYDTSELYNILATKFPENNWNDIVIESMEYDVISHNIVLVFNTF